MTGRYPQRFGFEFTPAPKAFMRLIAYMRRDEPRPPIYFADREADVPSMEQEGIPPAEITIAELLRERGYRTLGLGKWHLGEATPMQPNAQGFDEYLGFLSGGSLYLETDDPDSVNSVQDFDPIDQFLWANLRVRRAQGRRRRFAPDAYMTDYLAREAARAIEANRNRPFFVYLAFNAPHTPLQALRSDYEALSGIENHTLRVYAAMIRALDRGVGTVLDALRANGLEENTLVIFTSDNGGADYVGLPDINKPYRGWKMTFFEGGVHTPFFAKWPARLAAGQRYHAPVAHIDIFATAAGAAGAALPSDRPIDGVDLVKLARGEAQGRPHGAVFWRSGHYRTILADDWKLQVSERPAKTWLFDLSADPTEQRDLSAERPDKVRELSAILAEHEAQMVVPAWPALIEGAIAIDHPLNVPAAGQRRIRVLGELIAGSKIRHHPGDGDGASLAQRAEGERRPAEGTATAGDPVRAPGRAVHAVLRRDVGALLLLRNARAADPLHDQGLPRHERRPRLRGLRRLHRARLRDAVHRRHARRPPARRAPRGGLRRPAHGRGPRDDDGRARVGVLRRARAAHLRQRLLQAEHLDDRRRRSIRPATRAATAASRSSTWASTSAPRCRRSCAATSARPTAGTTASASRRSACSRAWRCSWRRCGSPRC